MGLTRLILAEHALVSRRALRIVAGLTFAAIIAAGVVVTITDAPRFSSVWEGWWWASTTVTTVGYGDLVPTSALGRLTAIVLMFLGIGLVSILTAAIASALVAEDVGDEEQHIDSELRAISSALVDMAERLASIEAAIDAQSRIRPR